MDVEPKVLRPEVMEYLSKQDWPGNVRQLENTCRWLTVMTTGQEVYLDDLPPELLQPKTATAGGGDGDWTDQLRGWAEARLRTGQINIAKDAIDTAESLLIETALEYTHGRRQDAAKLLGYGRNTLTRKIKELNLPE